MGAEFLAAIIDHVAHPIFVKDRSFRWVIINRAFCSMVGHPRERLLGKTDYDFFPKSEADFFRAKDIEMFETGAEVVINEENATDVMGVVHVLATTKVPLRDATGAVTHLVGIIHDITPIKKAEGVLVGAHAELARRVAERSAQLEAAQAELVRKERLAVLGQLAGSIAHQIRNPLGSIKNAAYLLRMVLGHSPEPDVRSAIEIIHDEVRRANRIITDMVDYAKVQPAHPRPTALGYVLEQALGGLSIPQDVIVIREMTDLPVINVDSDQIQTALFNLVRNAVEAMPDGGTLTVSSEVTAAAVVLRIQDTGMGIPEDIRARLFEPLLTTKPVSMGLGLLTARTLIENQGGTLDCVSTQGKGTRFDVHLPRPA